MVLALACSMVGNLHAQVNDYNFWMAGLHFRPLIPTNVPQRTTIEVSGTPGEANEFMRVAINPQFGYSFGMIVRKNFTQRFAIETGINYVRRFYQVDVTDVDSAVTSSVDFGLTGYEIPLVALVYIRLGEDFYMNTSLGVSVDFMARSIANGTRYFDNFTAIRKVSGAALANVGVEYRSRNSGTFYVGVTYHQSAWPIADTKINYFRGSFQDASVETPLDGTYFTLDLRYYFNEQVGRRRQRW